MENTRTARYARFILRHRIVVLLLSLLVTAAMGFGATKIEFRNDYRYFFSEQNPNLAAFDQLQRTYSSPDNLMLILQPKDGAEQITDPKYLQVIYDMTDEAWQTPYVARVDSLTNFQRTRAEEDDLIVEDLVPDRDDVSRTSADDVRDYALSEPILQRRLISPDARTTAVVATLRLPEADPNSNAEAMAFGRAMQAKYREAYPDLRIELSGSVALSNAFGEAGMHDATVLTPIMYAFIALTVLILLRSLVGLGVSVVIVSVAVIGGVGGQGWFGIPLTPPSANAPTVILTVAVADTIHVLVTALVQMRKGLAKNDAIIESMRINMAPVFLTSVTTAIGFLSLNFSDAPPFRDLGTISAIGTMVAWAASITLLPALLSVLPLKAHAQVGSQTAMMERFSEFVIARRTPLLTMCIVGVVGLAAMIPTLKFNDVFPEFFDESIDFRQATDFTTENLTSIYQLHYSLEAEGGSNSISDPAYMNGVEALASWFRAQPEVMNVSAVTDVMKKVNRSMHADDPAEYQVPETREMNAQFLLLYEMSLPYGLDLNDQINVDKSATRMVVTINQIPTDEMNQLIDRAGDWMEANLPAHMKSYPAGHAVMFGFISISNFERMTVGTLVALALISACLMVALRSFRLGLISLVPNLLPPVAAFGIFALMFDAIGMYASFVIATALGLIVDATVHFLSKYRTSRVDYGSSAEEGVRYAFANTGTALLVSTLVLVVGFMVLSSSSFLLSSMLGLMVAITIAVALVLDFLLLPPLLILIDKNRDRSRASTDAAPAQAGE